MRYLSGGSIKVPEGYNDLITMWEWMESQHTLAVDLETTDLEIYADGFRIRLIALGTPTEAYVFPHETFSVYVTGLLDRLRGKRLIMHNGFGFDIPAMAHVFPTLGCSIEGLSAQTRDTKILAHQVDPRGSDEGGIGQTLDKLLEHYVPECHKLKKELQDEYQQLRKSGQLPKEASAKVADMYRWLPIDNELFLIYAGTDAIGAARLFQVLKKQVAVNSQLTKDDHKVAMIASLMDAKGFLLDVDYTQKLADTFFEEEERQKDIAWEYGIENINSAPQIAKWLEERGIAVPRTDKDNPSVDGKLLKSLYGTELEPAAEAILAGRKAGKWRKTWVEKFLDAADVAGRVHPSTNTLRARTARFSISGIPAQTLPSGDSLVRSCFVSDTGEVIVGVDYAQQELRFAAAKAPDARMIQAFRNGEDLHYLTAEAAWPGRGMEMRKFGKSGNFTVAYGGGVRALMTKYGMDWASADALVRANKSTYKGIQGFNKRLQAEARKFGYITTWTGRRLPVDEGHEYAAQNYFVQSGCRDLTAHAMIRLYDAGYVEHMRLPIHDEILFSLPNDQDMINDVIRLMSTKVGPLDIPAEAKIGSKSWGSLYG
jgi:DNA polymerase I-like protein with 3'-5' exonuclease and polymerase domains